jgi:hypothetical protein
VSVEAGSVGSRDWDHRGARAPVNALGFSALKRVYAAAPYVYRLASLGVEASGQRSSCLVTGAPIDLVPFARRLTACQQEQAGSIPVHSIDHVVCCRKRPQAGGLSGGRDARMSGN